MAFKYRARTEQDLQKRADQQGGDYQGFIADEFRLYTPKKGDNWIRILPPTWDDPHHYGMDLWVHYGIGPERASIICIAKQAHPTTGELSSCPICEARVRAERAQDADLADELKPARRVLVWLLDRKEEEKGPVIWPMPWTVDRDIVKISRDPRTGEIFTIDHPDTGYDVTFERTGDQLTTKYTGMQISRRPSSVDTQFLDYIEGAPLPFTLRWRDYDEVKKLFDGSGMEDAGARTPRGPRDGGRRDGAAAQPEQPAQPAAQAEAAPPPRRPIINGAANGNGNGAAREEAMKRNADLPDEPPPRERVAPARDEAAASTNAASKAEALRARFANKSK